MTDRIDIKKALIGQIELVSHGRGKKGQVKKGGGWFGRNIEVKIGNEKILLNKGSLIDYLNSTRTVSEKKLSKNFAWGVNDETIKKLFEEKISKTMDRYEGFIKEAEQNPKDSKAQFKAGIAQEILGNKKGAFDFYLKGATLGSSLAMTRAIKLNDELGNLELIIEVGVAWQARLNNLLTQKEKEYPNAVANYREISSQGKLTKENQYSAACSLRVLGLIDQAIDHLLKSAAKGHRSASSDAQSLISDFDLSLEEIQDKLWDEKNENFKTNPGSLD